MSRLCIFTICLDGQPWITNHLPIFNRLRIPWTWVIVEGVARNVGSTKWCSRLEPRLSNDGTTAYIRSIEHHPNVRYISRLEWEGGKDQMVCRALDEFKEPGVLLQVDSDELWLPEQLQTIVAAFQHNPQIMWMQFFCRYFLGQNIVITSENTYGNRQGEWLRAWRFKPGMRFYTHEPPILLGAEVYHTPGFDRVLTRQMGLVFDHPAYATEAQVALKEKYYNYPNATQRWKMLQANREWPVNDVSQFLPWVGPGVTADLLWKS